MKSMNDFSVLTYFAHPDDEGAIAGTLTRYARNGTEVSLICATKGEAGEISDPSLATPENLDQVRTAELQAACDIIGIRQLEFLGYRDSGMAGLWHGRSGNTEQSARSF